MVTWGEGMQQRCVRPYGKLVSSLSLPGTDRDLGGKGIPGGTAGVTGDAAFWDDGFLWRQLPLTCWSVYMESPD